MNLSQSPTKQETSGCESQGSCVLDKSSCSCISSCGYFYDAPGVLAIDAIPSSLPLVECGHACSCSSSCGNRTVQSGVQVPLLVKPSFESESELGLGLFCLTALPKGTFIALYSGQLISSTVAKLKQEERAQKGLGNYILTVRETFGNVLKEINIDPTEVGNVSRFANHACPPLANLIILLIHPRGSTNPLAAMFLSKDVKDGEELRFDYSDAGGDSWYFHRTKATQMEEEVQEQAEGGRKRTKCQCGSTRCRGWIPFSSN